MQGSQYSSNLVKTFVILFLLWPSAQVNISNVLTASSPMTDSKVETRSRSSCLQIPVAISYLCHTCFHCFQLPAKLSSTMSGLGGGRFIGGTINGASVPSSAPAILPNPIWLPLRTNFQEVYSFTHQVGG